MADTIYLFSLILMSSKRSDLEDKEDEENKNRKESLCEKEI